MPFAVRSPDTGHSDLAPEEVRKAKLLYLSNAISEFQAMQASYEGFGQARGCMSIIPVFWPIIGPQKRMMTARCASLFCGHTHWHHVATVAIYASWGIELTAFGLLEPGVPLAHDFCQVAKLAPGAASCTNKRIRPALLNPAPPRRCFFAVIKFWRDNPSLSCQLSECSHCGLAQNILDRPLAFFDQSHGSAKNAHLHPAVVEPQQM